MKSCCTCKQNKPLDAFYKSSRTKDGRQTQCITCDRARKKAPAERQRDREYHQKNKEKRNAYYREYRKKNRDVIYAKRRKYLEEYRRRNAEKIASYMTDYYSRPEAKILQKARKAKRRKLENTTSDGTLTAANLRALLEYQSNRCKHCGVMLFQTEKDTHLDHIIPLSSGGANSIFNVQWLCAKCNLRKGDKVYCVLPDPQICHLSTVLE